MVTAVQREGLEDITEEDAVAEGFQAGELDDGDKEPHDIGGGWSVQSSNTLCSAAGMFQITWAKLHPEWDGYSSPEVVAISFRCIKANIDARRRYDGPSWPTSMRTEEDGAIWYNPPVLAIVTMRRERDGVVRTFETSFSSDYAWSDGNDACDGNRGTRFARAAGEPAPPHVCGMTEYTVLSITDKATGELLYDED